MSNVPPPRSYTATVLLLRAPVAVGERRRRRLVDDADHVEAGDLPASFVACRWLSLKYAGTVMTAFAWAPEVVLREELHLLEHHRR
jgi:hypothetical protein